MDSNQFEAFGGAILEVVSHYPTKYTKTKASSLVHNYSTLRRQYTDMGKVKYSKIVSTYCTEDEIPEFYGDFFPELMVMDETKDVSSTPNVKTEYKSIIEPTAPTTSDPSTISTSTSYLKQMELQR